MKQNFTVVLFFMLQMDDIIALIRWMGVAKKRLKIVQVTSR